MDERLAQANKIIADSKKKAIELATGRREKRKSRGVKKEKIRKLGVRDLAEIFGFLYYEKYKTNTPVWGGKEIGQCSNLIKKLDFERAEKLVRFVFKNWDWLSQEIRVSGAPQVGDILVRCIRYAEEAIKREVGKDEDEDSGIIVL